LELVVPAIARGRQVVVVGDVPASSASTVPTLGELLPRVALVPDGSRRDPYVTAFLADHGYGGVLHPVPLPRAEPLVRLDQVDGVGMPDQATGAGESTQAEVDRVVEIAIEQAITRPDESFAIVTIAHPHAERLREALAAEVRQNPALAEYFSAARAEPVVIEDLPGIERLARDTIVLSVGFGRTPHGRVLHRFGALAAPGGDALLLGAIGAARKRLHVVAAFGVADLDPERLRGPGAPMLAELLALAQQRNGLADQVALGNGMDFGAKTDRLVHDLAEKLWRAGLIVETGYGIGGGERIPLVVGHPDLPGELLVAVLTDDAAYVAEPSIRVRDRQVGERLERIGWVVAQVWSAAAFLDPAKEAERLRRIVAKVRDQRVFAAPGHGAGDHVVVPVLEEEMDDDAGGR
jgi:hypothetical protein